MTPEKAYEQISREFLSALIQIAFVENKTELNFFKTVIKTPDNGVYLLQLQHVDGPKINLQVTSVAERTP